MNKTSKQLERHFKGIANHRRIDILFLLKEASGITLDNISLKLECNFKTISGHTQRLVQAGLINKKYKGQKVEHSLSPYGEKIVKLIEVFSYSREYKNTYTSS